MTNLREQLREYGEYLDELSPPSPSSIGNDRHRSRRPFAFAALAAVTLAIVAAVILGADREGPGRLITNAPTSSEPVSATSVLETTSVTSLTPAQAAIVAENPTLAQQITRLESVYRNAPADAPNGRPMLAAEYVFCDAVPKDPTMLRGTFASYYPLGQALTDARMAEACGRSDSPDPRMQPGAPFKLCATTMRGPRYDPSATATVPVTRPIVVFAAASCAAAGYSAGDGLLESVNALRTIEINLRAVPRDCPTEEEATAWVHKVTREQLGQEWTIGSPAQSAIPANGCYRPHLIDRETRQVHFLASPRS